MQVLHETKQREGFLPKKVILQIDNSWKENKNRKLLGLMAYLVQAAVVNEVPQIFVKLICDNEGVHPDAHLQRAKVCIRMHTFTAKGCIRMHTFRRNAFK